MIKRVNELQLLRELHEAGINLPAIGYTKSGKIITYNDEGKIIKVPPEAEVILERHVAAPEPLTRKERLDLLINKMQQVDTLEELRALFIEGLTLFKGDT